MEAELKNVRKQIWYHGLTPREAIDQLLKNVGDYAVRIVPAPAGGLDLVLAVRTKPRCHRESTKSLPCHFAVEVQKDSVSLQFLKDEMPRARNRSTAEVSYAFKSTVELIAYYTKNSIVPNVWLKNPIPRPKWLILKDSLELGEQIGKGNFSIVVRGLYKKNPSSKPITVAVKRLPPNIADVRDELGGLAYLFQESKLASKFRHPNVITFYGVSADVPPMMVVLEYCSGGSLVAHLTKFGPQISLGERVLFAAEASRGMEYMEHQHCVHRDLSARNCLISTAGVLKIGDFGLSFSAECCILENGNVAECVPIRWMAPETISRLPNYSHKSDVWSFGILVYEIFNNGIKPFAELGDGRDAFKKIKKMIKAGLQNLPTPEGTPSEMVEIMQKCRCITPDDRPTFRQIRQMILETQSNSELLFPTASECTTSRIQEVVRMEPKDEYLDQSMIREDKVTMEKGTTQTQTVTVNSDDRCSKEPHTPPPPPPPMHSPAPQNAPTREAHPKANSNRRPTSPINRTQPRSKKRARTMKTARD